MKGIYGIEVNMTKLIKEYMIEQVFIYVKEITIFKKYTCTTKYFRG